MSSSSSSTSGKQQRSAPACFQGKSYYEILNVPKTATKEEIKKAYRRCALRHHPDQNQSPTATEEFQYLAKVHETLYDEKKRRFYDQCGDSDGTEFNQDEFSTEFEEAYGT